MSARKRTQKHREGGPCFAGHYSCEYAPAARNRSRWERVLRWRKRRDELKGAE